MFQCVSGKGFFCGNRGSVDIKMHAPFLDLIYVKIVFKMKKKKTLLILILHISFRSLKNGKFSALQCRQKSHFLFVFFFQINFHIVSKSATSYMSNEEHACRPQSVITEHNVSH